MTDNIAARAEVEAWEAIWSGDWATALEAARKVIDYLTSGRAAGRYAGLWHYLAMSIALRLHHATRAPQYAVTAAAYLRTARSCARERSGSITWHPRPTQSMS